MLVAVLAHVAHLQDAQEFTEFVQQNDAVFIKFYRDACKYCQYVAPRFYDLSDVVHDAKFAQFDCDSDRAFCQSNAIDGVPALRLYKNGSHVASYDKTWRDPEPMREWLKENEIE